MSLEGKKTDSQTLTGDIGVKPGIDGKSVTIVKITESTEDGGNNIVEFSDGSRLKIKNGSGGKIGIDGKSAYQYAQDGGYTGTEEEFALLMSQENLQTEKVDKISIEVSKLSEEIEDVKNNAFSIVLSKNIYNPEGRTEGYYLSAGSGNPAANAEYAYSDYIEVKPNTTYYVSAGAYTQFVWFIATYDKNKNILSSVYYSSRNSNTFTTEENCKYIRVSQSMLYTAFQIEEGGVTDYEAHHDPRYYLNTELYNVYDYIVGKNQKYKTISEAVAAASDGQSIFVKNGTYDESIDAKGKTLTIIGESREGVKVVRSDNDYTNPPLNFSSGLVKNMSFVQTGNQDPSEIGNIYNAYACHVDFSSMVGKSQVFENCYFESEKNAAVGMGGWNGSKTIFRNCTFLTHHTSPLNGAIILHNNAHEASVDEFEFRGCEFVANNGCVCIKAQAFNTEGNYTKVTFVNNTASHNSHWLSNIETATVYTWSDLWNYELTNVSFGNKIDICNYS